MVNRDYSIVKQDTSPILTRESGSLQNITPLGAITSIVESITNVVNVYIREKNLTERVRLECEAAVTIARQNVEKMLIQKEIFLEMLKHDKEKRNLIMESIDRFWKQIELFDDELKSTKFQIIYSNPESLSYLIKYKVNIIEQIEKLLTTYYSGNVINNLTNNFQNKILLEESL